VARLTTPGGEPLYTLAEARPLIVRERCNYEGHDLERVLLQHEASGRVVVDAWRCAHGCDVRVVLRYPDPEEKK
jgi:hypothetical protein